MSHFWVSSPATPCGSLTRPQCPRWRRQRRRWPRAVHGWHPRRAHALRTAHRQQRSHGRRSEPAGRCQAGRAGSARGRAWRRARRPAGAPSRPGAHRWWWRPGSRPREPARTRDRRPAGLSEPPARTSCAPPGRRRIAARRRGGCRRRPSAHPSAPAACWTSPCTAGRAWAARRTTRGLWERRRERGRLRGLRRRDGPARTRRPAAAGERAGRAPWVLRASRTCSEASEGAICTHREHGQWCGVSSAPVCATARSVCRRAAACLRCARVPRKRGGWRGSSAAEVACAPRAAAEVGCAHRIAHARRQS